MFSQIRGSYFVKILMEDELENADQKSYLMGDTSQVRETQNDIKFSDP